jgi:hypothetical protein
LEIMSQNHKLHYIPVAKNVISFFPPQKLLNAYALQIILSKFIILHAHRLKKRGQPKVLMNCYAYSTVFFSYMLFIVEII